MKRRILGAIIAALSSLAFGASTVPPAMLNPSGSAAGQAIVSTGAASAPAWGGIGVNGIAALAANTVLANATSSSAAPTAFAMPSCSTATSALQWTSASGFTCYASSATTTGTLAQFSATTSAQLAGVLSDETGSGSAVFATSPTLVTPNLGTPTAATLTNATGLPIATGISGLGTGVAAGLANAVTGSGAPVLATSPTITTPAIAGVTNGSAAAAGYVGQPVTSQVLQASAVSLTSGTSANVTSISLTAGDWDVWGYITYSAGSSTTSTQYSAGINTTSATLGTVGQTWGYQFGNWTASQAISIAPPQQMINVSTSTTVYLVAQSTFATSTMSAYGFITARRRH